MTSTGEAAIAAAAYQSTNGPQYGTGQCMMRTRILFGAPAIGDYDGDGSADAEDGWKFAKLKHATTDPTAIPAAVPVWWGGGSNDNGHVAVSAGNGMCYSTDILRPGYYDLVPIDLIRQKWGLPLLGYSEDIDGVLAGGEAMTCYVIDVSHYQDGLKVAALKAQGYSALIVKCTEGSTYADPSYADFIAQAEACDMPVAAYHFLHAGSADKQAAWMAKHVGPVREVMIDAEAGGRPSWADITAFIAGCTKRGLRVTLNYLPRSYWAAIGSPTLKGTPAIVNAAYPSSKRGYGSALYPGNNDSHWDSYGGVTPTLWQYASSCKIDGYSGSVDVSAFRGTSADLAALFHTWTATPAPKPAPTPTTPTEDTVTPADIDAIANAVLAKLRVHVPDNETSWPGKKDVGYSAAGQRVLGQLGNVRSDIADVKATLEQAIAEKSSGADQ